MGELAERWMAVEHHQSRAWRDAAGMSDLVLPLDPGPTTCPLRRPLGGADALPRRSRDLPRTSNPCTCPWPASHVWTSAGERRWAGCASPAVANGRWPGEREEWVGCASPAVANGGVVVSALTVRQVRRRYLTLYGLRWLPTGLMMPVMILLMQRAGPFAAADRPGGHRPGPGGPRAGVAHRRAANALGRQPVLLAAGVLNLAPWTVRGGRLLRLFFLVWALQGVFRALDSGPLESWYVDATLAADPEAKYEPGLDQRGHGNRWGDRRWRAARRRSCRARPDRAGRRAHRAGAGRDRPAGGGADRPAAADDRGPPGHRGRGAARLGGPAPRMIGRPSGCCVAPGCCWRWWPLSCSGASAWSPSSRCCRSGSPR